MHEVLAVVASNSRYALKAACGRGAALLEDLARSLLLLLLSSWLASTLAENAARALAGLFQGSPSLTRRRQQAAAASLLTSTCGDSRKRSTALEVGSLPEENQGHFVVWGCWS